MSGIALEKIRKLLETAELPELGPGPRAGAQPQAAVNRAVDELVGGMEFPREKQQLFRALVLLWHDHLEAAHGIAQEIENADGAFVHGIMHRREPDYGNAAYWFRRVGKHPAFSEIAKRAGKALEAKNEAELSKKLISGGEWDPFAFITACEGATRNSSRAEEKDFLRE